jgi:hypothetical protein
MSAAGDEATSLFHLDRGSHGFDPSEFALLVSNDSTRRAIAPRTILLALRKAALDLFIREFLGGELFRHADLRRFGTALS